MEPEHTHESSEHTHSHTEESHHVHEAHVHHETSHHTGMAYLAYLGPLVIIPYFAEKHDPFVKFHTKQGLVVFAIEVLIWILTPMLFWNLWFIFHLLKLCTLILSIIGIVNVSQKKEKMLPVVGDFARHFKF